MSTFELKGEILQWVSEINDETTLARVRAYLGTLLKKKVPEPDWWDELTPEQQADLDEGIREMDDDSKWVPHEEVMELFAKYR